MTTLRAYERQEYKNKLNTQILDEELENELVLSVANKAFAQAANETMQIMGYNVIAENGWVIKIYEDGTKEKIKEIGNRNNTTHG